MVGQGIELRPQPVGDLEGSSRGRSLGASTDRRAKKQDSAASHKSAHAVFSWSGFSSDLTSQTLARFHQDFVWLLSMAV
jgi:hypothetical protein